MERVVDTGDGHGHGGHGAGGGAPEAADVAGRAAQAVRGNVELKVEKKKT